MCQCVHFDRLLAHHRDREHDAARDRVEHVIAQRRRPDLAVADDEERRRRALEHTAVRVRRAMRSKTSMHLSGYLPTVVSPLSMMASALLKNRGGDAWVTSARVGVARSGTAFSSMCVATMTGRPTRRQVLTMRRWTMGSSS